MQNSEGRELQFGNILGSAWGYGATNRSFYIITAVSKTGRVKVRPIKKEKVRTADIENGEWSNYVSPRIEFDGPETGYKQVFSNPKHTNPDCDNLIKISDYERAYKIADSGDEAETLRYTETNSYYI
jgi:hypothetical protein